MNFGNALRGMRNPMESYYKADTFAGLCSDRADIDFTVAEKWVQFRMPDYESSSMDEIKAAAANMKLKYVSWLNSACANHLAADPENGIYESVYIGPNDMKLAQQLIKAGSEHRKFMRQIIVSVDITAPLYWWKEFDTYKVGTVANSTSTMHKIQSKPITLDCFEIGDYDSEYANYDRDNQTYNYPTILIEFLECLRKAYLETKDKKYWKELIRWLPEGWLQTRTVTMSYENLLAMCSCGQRRFHKLSEWSTDFITFARSLPYAQELLFIDEPAATRCFEL